MRICPKVRGFVVAILGSSIVLSPVLAAGTTGHTTGGSLHGSSGGTGLSSHGGSGGTGLSSHGSSGGSLHGVGAKTPTSASSPASNTQQTMTPAKLVAPPPAGPRPHTDLSAAAKLMSQSSAALIKRSSLFPKQPLPPGDPALMGPVLNQIGPTTGGSASFKAVSGIAAAESNGNIYPASGGHASGGRAVPSLWGGSASTALASAAAADEATTHAQGGGWLLGWLTNALALFGIAGLSWWLWHQAPTGARMTLPVRLA